MFSMLFGFIGGCTSPESDKPVDETTDEADSNLLILWQELSKQIPSADQPDAHVDAIRSWLNAESSQPILAKVSRLNLWGRDLTTLPPEIGRLGDLRFLYLTNNHLTFLPKEISLLTKLAVLSIDGNQLNFLQPEIGELISLQALDLSANPLSTLPPEVSNLKKLRFLSMQDCSLSELQISSIRALLPSGCQFLFNMKAQPEPATRADMWHLFGENGINIEAAWPITTGSSNTTIAIIEPFFGIDSKAYTTGNCLSVPKHYILSSYITAHQYLGHGVAVSSMISDCPQNVLGLQGINNRSPLLWIDQDQSVTLFSLPDYLYWAIGISDCAKFSNCSSNTEPADIISMSLGGKIEEPTIIRQIQSVAVARVNARPSILVASAGNDSSSADTSYPTSLTGIISVGATQKNGEAAGFSNWGETVEIMAPGKEVAVALERGWGFNSGTSFAAPTISGVLSLMHSVYSGLNWKRAVYLLQSTAVPMSCDQYCSADYTTEARDQCKKDCCVTINGELRQTCTPGRVDAGAAVAAAQNAEQQPLAEAFPVALVDSNIYVIPLTAKPPSTIRTGAFTLTNVGGVSGQYTLTSTDPNMNFSANKVSIAPGEQINITVTTSTAYSILDDYKIRIASPESGMVSSFSDELVVYAQSMLGGTSFE